MLRIGIVLAVIVALCAIVWIGSEMHYRSCVNAAVASTPAPKPPPALILSGDPPLDASREQAVHACSRLPF